MHHPVDPRAVGPTRDGRSGSSTARLQRFRASIGTGLARAAAALAAGLVAAVALAASAPAAPPGVLVLTEAWVAYGGTDTFPESTSGRALSLPAIGRQLPIDQDGAMWVRLRFDRPADAAALLSAHLPSSCGWLDVDLNRQPVQRDSDRPAEETSICPRPRLIALPPALLRARDNVLDLRLRGTAPDHVTSPRRAAALSEVWIGPSAALARAQSGAGFWLLTAVRVIHIAVAMLGAFMLALSVAQRRDRHLVWFGLTALGWSALLTPVWWMSLPFPSRTLELLLSGLLAPTTACAIHFIMRFGDRALPRPWATALWLQCLLLPASLVLVPEAQRQGVAYAWWWLLGAQLLAALAIYLADRRRDHREVGMVSAILVAAAVGWAVDGTQVPGDLPWPATAAWVVASPLGWSVLVIAVGLRLLLRFNQALLEAEANRLSLEGQVREITAEIEHNFAQLAEMRVEQITEQERKRIAADLHDDLGAKLLTIVHTCNNERIAALGREALDEMRLSVRGLSGKPVRLLDAMADWRAETVQRLAQTHIQVAWENPADDNDSLLPARAFVQTTRILREAVSNIIKHSGASHCEVRCYAGEGAYGVVVEDNGRGIPVDFDNAPDRGHGMTTMKHRAKQLNGQCLVESGPGLGTVIRLSLPL